MPGAAVDAGVAERLHLTNCVSAEEIAFIESHVKPVD
jgi:hypothetical protein